MWRSRTLILILWFVSPVLVLSMRFDLHSGIQKCITEDIKNNAMTVGKYNVVNPNEGYPMPDTHKITIREFASLGKKKKWKLYLTDVAITVTSPHGNNYHYGDHVNSGTFAFTAAEAGNYVACFWAPNHNPPITLSIDFEWKTGVAAKDWPNVAKKEQIEVMELELKKLFDVVSSIHEEMFYLREREEEMQELNISTNSKMATFSFFSLLICLAVAGLQLWHLKNFFESKKLL